MRFDRETWVKLYRAESPQHRLMSLGARSFRDFLLRFADEKGELLGSSSNIARDICRVIGADSKDVKVVRSWVGELTNVGFLSVDQTGRVVIGNFVIAQTARSPGAKRQAEYEARQKEKELARQKSVRTDANLTVRPDVINEEMRGEEIPPVGPPEGTVDPAEPIVCPRTLLPQFVVDDLAGYFQASPSLVLDAEREFKGYWTVGKGAGRKFSRAAWIAKCREWIRRRFEDGTVRNSSESAVVVSP